MPKLFQVLWFAGDIWRLHMFLTKAEMRRFSLNRDMIIAIELSQEGEQKVLWDNLDIEKKLAKKS
jgi:hypothetical protein